MRLVKSKLLRYFPKDLRRRLDEGRRRTYEIMGFVRYSQPALNQIDQKLEKYLSFRDGIFIEAGANDGFAQSNTYYLERFRGWRGILVEPIPELYERCIRIRPNSIVFNCALVAADHEDKTVKMMYSNLMSLVCGAQGSSDRDLAHIQAGMEVQNIERTYEIEVPARTLASILDETNVGGIDLLSLDVEGYELDALKGLDLCRYQPRYLLIEANFRDEIDRYLAAYGYGTIDRFSDRDFLYAKSS